MRVGLDRPQDILNAVGLYAPTAAGANITHESSVRISTVYACVYKIASTLAMHSAAMKPSYLSKDEVPASLLEQTKEEAKAQLES